MYYTYSNKCCIDSNNYMYILKIDIKTYIN